jgi:VWFA-related protein
VGQRLPVHSASSFGTLWAVVVALGLGAAVTLTAQRPSFSPGFAALLQQYIQGDAEPVIAELASWPDDRLDAEGGAPPPSRSAWDLAAYATLHAEAALEAGYRNRDWIAEGALRDLIPRALAAEDEALVRVSLDLSVVLLSAAGHSGGIYRLEEGRTGSLIQRHLGSFPEVQLVIGSVVESSIRAFHAWQSFRELPNSDYARSEMVFSNPHGEFSGLRWRVAELALKRTLERDPSLVEARVRLGRLQYLAHRSAPAQEILETALGEALAARDEFSAYVAALFLGDVHEFEGRLDEAAAAYRQALDLHADAHAPHVALGNMLLESGRPVDGWAALRRAFDAGEGKGPEPWTLYRGAQVHQKRQRLDRVRQLIGRHFGTSLGPRMVPDPGPAPASLEAVPAPAVPAGRVRVDFSVRDRGRPVPGLTRDDLFVLDDGRQERIDSLVPARRVAVALVLDRRDRWARSTDEELVTAAGHLMDALEGGDVLSVVATSDRMRLVAHRTSDTLAVRERLNALPPGAPESSALWDAVLAAASLVEGEAGRRLVVVASDVYDNASWIDEERVVERLEGAGITLDIVHSSQRRLARSALLDIAKATGGRVFDGSRDDCPAELRARLADLRSGYVLTYTPSTGARDDRWRRLDLLLRDRSGRVDAPRRYHARLVPPAR